MSDRMSPQAHCRTARHRAGFTLLELMVSLGVGGIAITSIYAVGASATRQFQQQENIAGTQTGLRIAMGQLKRDIARAGYLATPSARANSTTQLCGPLDSSLDDGANIHLAAFSDFQDNIDVTEDATALAPPNTDNDPADFSADQIVLLGNYETASEYAGVRRKDTNSIYISQNWQAFQRDFTNWFAGSPAFNPVAFSEVFKVGRLIRIQTTHKLRHFARITSVELPTVTGQDVVVVFTPPIPTRCLGLIENGWVAPLSAIQLLVRDSKETMNSSQNGTIGQLIRREVRPEAKDTFLPMIDPTGGEAGNANSRSILDYVVSFNLSFRQTAVVAAGQPDSYDVQAAPVNDVSTINNFPETIRSVQIDLAARTPLQDPGLVWSRVNCSQLRCFKVLPQTGPERTPGAARVRRMRSEVFVPNVAFEGH